MPVNTRELRRRIRATKSIKQITKAMEMIAASKMRRAQLAALASRPYMNLTWEIRASIAASTERSWHPLLRTVADTTDMSRLVLVLTPNRGLCGSLPTQLITEALRERRERTQYVTVGRKAQRGFARRGIATVAHFDGFETQPSIAEARPIARLLMDTFTEGVAHAVDIVYADFISTLQYNVRTLRLLPLSERDLELGSVHEDARGQQPVVSSRKFEFLFEPSPKEVLDELLPRLVELQIYQALLEALASEHSARMVTMQNASKAADDLIDDFTLTYNAARQAAITAELADIVGGRLALHP